MTASKIGGHRCLVPRLLVSVIYNRSPMLSPLLVACILAASHSSEPQTIREAALRADVDFLCDPLLEGRATPSRGLRTAAAFIRARFERLGIAALHEDGYEDPIPLAYRRIDPKRTHLVLEGQAGRLELTFGEDYFPERLSHLVPWSATGPLISVGTGQSPEIAPLDLVGKWVVLFEHESPRLRPALQRLAAAGAAGAIVAPGPHYAGDTFADRFGDGARKMLDGITTRLGGEPRGPDLPLVALPRTTWERIEAWSGVHSPADEPTEAGTSYGVVVHDRRTLVEEVPVAPNLVGFLPGTDPTLAGELLLVVAHYDGPGTLGGRLYPGANDNASGTAALLALAEALAKRGRLSRGVLFLATAGSGQGSLGARRFLTHTGLEEGQRVVLVVELESLGGGPPDAIRVGPPLTSTWRTPLVGSFAEFAAAQGFPVVQEADRTWPRSEARVLTQGLEAPSILITGGPTHRERTPEDRPHLVQYGKVARASRAALALLRAYGD